MASKKKVDNKYAVENLPISDSVREGLCTGVFIDVLSALGTMMSLQDDAYEDTFDDVKKGLKDLLAITTLGFSTIDARLTSIELRLSNLEAKDKSLEEKISVIERRLDDYYLRLKNHKHEDIAI